MAASVAVASLAVLGAGSCVAGGAFAGEKMQTAASTQKPAQDWPVYGGQNAQDHYSGLSQIDKKNVKDLTVAWKFDSGEKGGMQTSPLVIGRTLFALTPSQKVIALDATSGKLLWKFDSGIEGRQPDRGLAYWTDGKDSRLFAGVMNFLYALDPVTGKPILSFGEEGRIDLRKGLGETTICNPSF
jgi:quinoprotein glucose dehydrogenase